MPVRLTDNTDLWFRQSVELHALGEPIVWEAFPMLVQTPQGIVPHMIFTIQLPGAVLGQVHFDATQHPFPALTEAYVEQVVGAAVTRLLAFRSQELANVSRNGAAPAGPGQGKLILP